MPSFRLRSLFPSPASRPVPARSRSRWLLAGLAVAVTAPVVTLTGTALAGTAAAAAAPSLSSVRSVDDRDNAFQYSGSSWTYCGGCDQNASGGGYRYAYRTGDRATLKFTGTGLRLLAFTEPPGGIGRISIDGATPVDVDFYAPTKKLAAVFSTNDLPNGDHTLTIEVTGRRNQGTSPTLTLDRAEIYDGAAAGSTPPTTSTPPPSTSTPPPTTSTPPPTSSNPGTATGAWMSGASGSGIATGAFAGWRGTQVPIASTWSDTNWTAASNSWQFDPGAEYGNWTGSIDWSPGATWGASWSSAAAGELDAKWTAMLQTVKRKWTSKPRGTFYIRFAHEMNGYWFQHSVKANEIESFKAAWQRFHRIKQSVFPEAKLVFNTNANTNTGGGQFYDWRKLWPGDAYVDVYSTDFYSNHMSLPATDSAGAPQQLEQHRQFAQAHGKPFAVSEWGNNIDSGDKPAYIQMMYDFFKANGGTGAGKVLYECYFNVTFSPRNQFGLYPTNGTLAPQAAAKYQQLF